MSVQVIRRVAYEDRSGGKVFVADPSLRGRYILTDPCVVLRPCPYCKAVTFEPCISKQGYGAGTHVARRPGLRGDTQRGAEIGDQVVEEIEAAPAPDGSPDE